MTPEESHTQAAHMTECILHLMIFAGVMLLLAITAFFAGSWGWFLAALFGWGIVLLGQAAYVFVWEPRVQDPTENPDTMNQMQEESKKIAM